MGAGARVSWAASGGTVRCGSGPGSGISRPRPGPGRARRAHVKADDVADLADELRVRAELPGLDRLEPEGPPDPRDRRLRRPGLGGHRPGRPVAVLPGPLLGERARDQRFYLLV